MTHPCRALALAGGGPLGAIYEIGALVALGEALDGLNLTDCDLYVGVSSGSFIAAGLVNGITAPEMHAMFIESDAADDPFEPGLLLRPALGEYANRLAAVPQLLASAARQYLEALGIAWVLRIFWPPRASAADRSVRQYGHRQLPH